MPKISYKKEFKFKVVLDALSGDHTIAELMSKYSLSKSTIFKWKAQFLQEGKEIFSPGKSKNSSSTKHNEEQDIDQLHKIIGKLKVENDFLQSASNRLEIGVRGKKW